MSEYLMDLTALPLVIGLTGLEEIEQNIRIIVRSFGFDVRLDCAFAHSGAYIDSPLPHATALRIANLTEAIEKYEPRVKVLSLNFAPDAKAAVDGKIFPQLRYAVKEGII